MDQDDAKEPDDRQRYWDIYTAIARLAQESSVNIPIIFPRFVVVGFQTSGKTSFIELLLGHPVGHTSGETATRCPVVYNYTRHADFSISISVGFNPPDWALTLGFF
jgi:hypothetical protein